MKRLFKLSLILLCFSCAHHGKHEQKTTDHTGVSEDHPAYHERETYLRYRDKRYEKDPAFKHYYNNKPRVNKDY